MNNLAFFLKDRGRRRKQGRVVVDKGGREGVSEQDWGGGGVKEG